MPLGFSVKEEAKRESDNSLAAINRRAAARRARSRREVEQREASRGWSTRDAQPQEWAETMRRVAELPPQAPAVMSYEDVRALAAAQDAWAAEHNGGVGGAAELSERTSNPNYWGPVADALSAPFEVLGMGNTGARNTLENNLRSVGEGIVGPEELMGAARRDARGEADGWDYATIGLTALPFDGLLRPAGRAIGNSRVGQAARGALDYVGDSRVGRWLGENVISPADEVAEAVARPRYEVRPDGTALSVRREGLVPPTTPANGSIEDLRAVVADPQRNPARRIADEEAIARNGAPLDLSVVPQTSLRRQGGIARMFEAATEGDDAYKSALFEQYGQALPRVVEQSGAQNYDQLTEAAYRQLASEAQQQFDRLPVGMQYHYGDREYETPSAMFRDALGNGNLNVFRGGDPHPYLSDIDPATGLSANEQFRAVHDYLGHLSNGSTFRPGGEEMAYAAHAQTLSPLAQMALLSETRGQNSWVNYGTANAPLIGEMNTIRRQLAGAGGAEADALRARLRDLGGQFQYAAQEPVLLPPDYLGIGSEGGVPEWARGLIVPRAPISVRGEHYSRVDDLAQTDPSFYGTGHIGAERPMVRREGLPDRTYFYSEGADGSPITPEDMVAMRAPYRYEAELQNIYDVNADPEGIVALANAHNQDGTALPDIERLARQYGYSGYVSDFAPSWAPQSRRAAAVFDPVNVRRLP